MFPENKCVYGIKSLTVLLYSRLFHFKEIHIWSLVLQKEHSRKEYNFVKVLSCVHVHMFGRKVQMQKHALLFASPR